MRTRALAVLIAMSSLLLVGCGGNDDSDETTSASKTESEPSDAGSSKSGSTEDLETQLTEALDAGDCDKVNSLNPSTRPSLDTKERCETLRLFKDFEVTGSEDYGDGAVVDLLNETGLNSSAVFVREADGSLSLVYIDNLRAGKTVGTKPAKAFDDAAADAAVALAKKDCDALLEASYVRRGFAVGERDTVCARLENFPVASLASRLPDDPPELVGGNSEFAFYALGEGEPRVILIMAHQEPVADLFTTDVPKGGTEYGFLDAYPLLDTKDDDKAE